MSKYRKIVLERIKSSIKINSKSTAVIVVDLMNDCCEPKGIFNQLGFDTSMFSDSKSTIINTITELSAKNLKVIYVSSYYDHSYLPNSLKTQFSEFGLDGISLFKKGTWGCKLIQDLPNVNDAFVIKSHFSAFAPQFHFVLDKTTFENHEGYFNSTFEIDEHRENEEISVQKLYENAQLNENKKIGCSLDFYLKSNGINDLVIIGGSTHVCLASTVYAASERGYNIILPIDLIASEDLKKHWMFLENFSFFNAAVCYARNLTFE